jgi:hypothetical protein
LPHCPQIRFLSPFAVAAQLHVVDHALSAIVHNTSLLLDLIFL